MWDKLFAWFRMAWDSGAETQRNSKLIRELHDQNVNLAGLSQHLFIQQAHERELREKEVARLEQRLDTLENTFERRLRDEAEKTELRLRLEMAQQMKQLPPPEKTNE